MTPVVWKPPALCLRQTKAFLRLLGSGLLQLLVSSSIGRPLVASPEVFEVHQDVLGGVFAVSEETDGSDASLRLDYRTFL